MEGCEVSVLWGKYPAKSREYDWITGAERLPQLRALCRWTKHQASRDWPKLRVILVRTRMEYYLVRTIRPAKALVNKPLRLREWLQNLMDSFPSPNWWQWISIVLKRTSFVLSKIIVDQGLHRLWR